MCVKLYIFWFLHQTTTIKSSIILNSLLYIFWFLHQTTTHSVPSSQIAMLYIFWFLHQTTTYDYASKHCYSCISFDSYIKPQPAGIGCQSCGVVYLLIPTSNHNSSSSMNLWKLVVYLLIPTSNHNLKQILSSLSKLYIFWFLHQTTTNEKDTLWTSQVVYLLIPTSNHNSYCLL